MKTFTRIYYILIGIPVLVISLLALLDYSRSGEFRAMMRDPGLWIVVVGALAALALAIVYWVRRGGPASEAQFGCTVMIALVVVALVAIVICFIVLALSGGVLS